MAKTSNITMEKRSERLRAFSERILKHDKVKTHNKLPDIENRFSKIIKIAQELEKEPRRKHSSVSSERETEAENIIKSASIDAASETIKKKEQFSAEANQIRSELRETESRLSKREDTLNKQVELAQQREKTLEEQSKEVRGRDQVSGLPKTIQVTSGEITEAIAEPIASIVGVVKGVLEKTPPELASDVIDRGIVMTGGGSLLRDFDQLLTKATGVPCYVAENPMACVALGAGKALEDYEVIKRSLPDY